MGASKIPKGHWDEVSRRKAQDEQADAEIDASYDAVQQQSRDRGEGPVLIPSNLKTFYKLQRRGSLQKAYLKEKYPKPRAGGILSRNEREPVSPPDFEEFDTSAVEAKLAHLNRTGGSRSVSRRRNSRSTLFGSTTGVM